MKVYESRLQGLKVILPTIYRDTRGCFFESWNANVAKKHDINVNYVQDNISRSSYGVLRGLHLQTPDQQAKLVTVLQGEVYDVAVDLRKDSPTFGEWEGFRLDSIRQKQLFIPEGFAHGFVTLSKNAIFGYKVNQTYNPSGEICIKWNDPDLNIHWPEGPVKLSPKDDRGWSFREFLEYFPNGLDVESCEASISKNKVA